ncbi:glycosyltransferase [Clostridioides difficile]
MKKCTMKYKKVQILMSTFNGEKYLNEQLDSFLNLEGFESIKVLIRDDGSTDRTREILESYQKSYGFEIILGENVGVNKSFFELLNNCDMTCEYFAISDQDDVWLSNKISIALEKMSKCNNNKPVLFASCSEVVDENLNHLGSTIIPNKGISFYNAISQNVLPGHTQVMNLELVKLLTISECDRINVIDWWIYLIASSMGEIVFEKKFTVLHRQHGINAVGYELNFFKSTFNRINRIKEGKMKSISLQIKYFYENYKNNISEEYKKEIERFLDSQNHLYRRILYIIRSKVYRQTPLETCIFKILYITGKYKI